MKNSIFIIVFLSLFSCKEEPQSQPETPQNTTEISITEKQFLSNNMKIEKLQNIDFKNVVAITGKIDVPPQFKAKIASIIGGNVVTTSVMIGDIVKKGQTIAVLENIELIEIQKNYLEIGEQLTYLKSEYERQKTLFTEKITSQKNYLKAESDYNTALGSYNSLREKLTLIGINPSSVSKGTIRKTFAVTSPINGVVTQNNANIGAFITADKTIVEVINPAQLIVDLAVFEKDAMKINEGQTIDFQISEVSTEIFPSKVIRVAKSIDEENRTISVYGNLADSLKQKLVAGMFVNAQIIIGNKTAKAVPNEAVFEENNKKMVLIVDKKEKTNIYLKKHEVFTGNKNEKFTEILPSTKLPENVEILTKGSYDIVN